MGRTLEHVPQTWRRTVIEGRTHHLPEEIATREKRLRSSARIIEEVNVRSKNPFWPENGHGGNGGNGQGKNLEKSTTVIWQAETNSET
jgi:hypothetical protein